MSPQPASDTAPVQNRTEPWRWRQEALRVLAVLAVSTALALLTNRFSQEPVPLLAPDGPGAPTERALRISIPALREALEADAVTVLVDVRAEEQFHAGHAAFALNLPYVSHEREFRELYREKRFGSRLAGADDIVMICESADCTVGDRAAKSLRALLLSSAGRAPRIRVLHGGWQAYKNSDLPLEDSAP